MSKFIQFELWKDCKNNCKFCYNKGEPNTNKLKRLDYILDKLDSTEIDLFNEIGFIGGEFFDGPLDNEEVKKKFYSLFDKCAEKKKENKISKLNICTALIFDINKSLVDFLNYLNKLNLLDITLLCTSYDTIYRFNNIASENLWKSNMKALNIEFPKLRIHTEVLLTQDFINKVLANDFNITEFCKEYNTTIDYIEPSTGFFYKDKYEMAKILPLFFPTKHSFVRFIRKTVIEDKTVSINDLLNPFLRANVLYYTQSEENMVIRGRQRNPDQRILKKLKKEDLDFGDEFRTVPQIYKDFDRGFIDTDISMLTIVQQFSEIISEV